MENSYSATNALVLDSLGWKSEHLGHKIVDESLDVFIFFFFSVLFFCLFHTLNHHHSTLYIQHPSRSSFWSAPLHIAILGNSYPYSTHVIITIISSTTCFNLSTFGNYYKSHPMGFIASNHSLSMVIIAFPLSFAIPPSTATSPCNVVTATLLLFSTSTNDASISLIYTYTLLGKLWIFTSFLLHCTQPPLPLSFPCRLLSYKSLCTLLWHVTQYMHFTHTFLNNIHTTFTINTLYNHI